MSFFHRGPPERTLPDAWRHMLEESLSHWHHLNETERSRIGHLSGRLLSDKRWEAAKDFELRPDMTLLIAAQASLLILGLDFDYFDEVGAIIVHPTTIVLTGPRGSPVPGLMTDAPTHILGQAAERGPVVIAWDEADHNARHPEHGSNVVLHEFAHKLDMLDHVIDGTPPLRTDQLDRWVEACTHEYEALQTMGSDDLLGPYAAVNPGEFFAVATERFFTVPIALRSQKPELYGVMADFYNQDPAARLERV